jgi:hypothetical protein
MTGDQKDNLRKFAVALLCALPFLAGGMRLLFTAGLGAGFIGSGLIIIGACILAWPFARLIAESTGSLFYPSQSDPAPPQYSIAESLVKAGRYQQALAKYEEIAACYPGETKPFIDMIEIAIVRLHDSDLAERIYDRGIRSLATDAQRETLSRMYVALRSTLTHRPS